MEDHPEASCWQATDTAAINSAPAPCPAEWEPDAGMIIFADCMTFLSVVSSSFFYRGPNDQRVRQDANLCARTPACAPGRQSMP